MKSKLLFMFFCLSCIFQLNAQVIPKDIVDRVMNSTNIFEGRVIRSNSYWSHDKKYIYTSSTIEIYKIFKGNISCGKIEVITDGGNVNDTTLEISHNLVLKAGMLGIFLCKETQKELPVIDFYPENNSLKLDFPFGLEAFIKYYEDGINKEVVDWQFSLDSLAQAYNLMELFTTLNLVDCNPGSVILHNHANDLQHVTAPLYPNLPIQMPPPTVNVQSTNSELSFELLNRHITSTIPRYFEFDIALSDNLDTNWFCYSDITLDYDGNIFGDNITSGGRIIVEDIGPITNSTAYFVNPFDDPGSPNKVVVQIVPTVSVVDQLINLPSVSTPLVHVKMEILDCNFSSYISITNVNSGWLDSASYYGQYLLYDVNNISSTIQFPSCDLHIDAINPLKVKGGTGDTVTVTGLNFDTAKGNGNIYLRNANDDMSYLVLDSSDYLLWSDSVIKFIMPGNIENNTYFNNNQYGIPGSGNIKMQNNMGDSVAGDSITVWYSITSSWSNLLQSKQNWNLVKSDVPTVDGYEFRYDTAFSKTLHPDRWEVLDIAIKQWVCLNNVNFVLGDSIVPQVDTARADNINMIQLGRVNAWSTLAATLQWVRPSCGYYSIPEIDIIVNKDIIDSLFFNTYCTADIPAHKYDFYAILLHELGCCLFPSWNFLK